MENYESTYVQERMHLKNQSENEVYPSIKGRLRIDHTHFPPQDRRASLYFDSLGVPDRNYWRNATP